MRTAIVTLMILAIAGSAIAADLGATRDQKETTVYNYDNPVEHKQGGDTIFDAFVIPGLPFNDTGTTFGYVNDYDEICPYSGSLSPDVVYTLTPAGNVNVLVDLCGSDYDTKLYVYDSGLNLIGCNDDFYFDDVCGVYVSAIENLPLTGGQQYYIVVDGYGSSSGNYVLTVEGFEPCVFVGCHPDAVPEGEPHLFDGYADATNGGCNSPEFGNPFGLINWINVDPSNPMSGSAWMCGRSGWYIGPSGGDTRDTDWFSVFAMTTGVMEFTVESEYPVYMFTLAPTDCAVGPGVVLQAIADCDAPATLAFPVVANTEYWLWVGPTTFTGPVTEFNYIMYVTNNMYDVVGTDEMTFGGVKALFR